MADAPENRFVRALAAGILRSAAPSTPVERVARAALVEALAAQKSLVLDVQFTGFTRRGEAVGGVHPALLKAAGQLIMLRVNRIGVTADAREEDLALLFGALGSPPAELPPGGVVALLAETRPHGVYVSTSSGEVYRPVPRETGAPPAPAAETGPQAPAPPEPAEASPLELADFELLDASLAPLSSGGGGEGEGAAPPTQADPPPGDLFHFFRANTGPAQEEAETLAEQLHAVENLSRFDELTQAATAAVSRLLGAREELRAILLLEALVEEAQRPDRTRTFRDSAMQALRRASSERALGQLVDLLATPGEVRPRLLRVLVFLGGDAVVRTEGVLFRTQDAGLRADIFRALLQTDPMNQRLLVRALEDPVPARTRSVLELASLPGTDPALTLRWAERAGTHADPTVRMDAVRMAGSAGGRGGLRVLLDLLSDPDRQVRRTVIQTLGRMGDAAAVPFLARTINEADDEEIQLEAVTALGRIGSAEVLPVLTGVLNKRQLFGGRRLLRLKTAAVEALGRARTPGAREMLVALAGGRDAEVAAEAKRVLATSERGA